jgi:putative addiction module killer protein
MGSQDLRLQPHCEPQLTGLPASTTLDFMLELIKSATFDRWLSGLRDFKAAARIQIRLDRLSMGNIGDVKPVGGGISEMKITYGPGYRVYLMQRGKIAVILLCGGDKSTQRKDIL